MERFDRHDWMMAAGFMAFALILRLVFLWGSPDRSWPHSIWYEGDAPLWVEYASALDRGEAFEFNLPIHPPGVAFPLSWFYSGVREHDFVAIKILWCVFSAAACGALYMACVTAIGRRPALLATLLCSVSFGQLVLATSLNSEVPYIMLLCVMVAMSLRAVESPRWFWFAMGLGVLHGLALLLRPEHLLMVTLWCGWMLWHRRRRLKPELHSRWARAAAGWNFIAIMVVAMLLTCLPWSIRASMAITRFNNIATTLPKYEEAPIPWTADARAEFDRLPAFTRHSNFKYLNHLAGQRNKREITPRIIKEFFQDEFRTTPRPLKSPVMISNQGPMSFALANHPLSDGGFTRHALEHPKLLPNPTFNITFPPHLQIMNEGYFLGWQWIRDDPLRWLRLVRLKFDRFLGGVTHGLTAANLPIGTRGVRQPVDMIAAAPGASTGWKLIVVALIAGGIAICCRRRVAGLWLLIIIYKLAVTVLFYGYARQAASISPAFFICIALALDTMIAIALRRWPRLGALQFWAFIAIVLGVMAIDLRSAISPARPQPQGSLTPRPEWGDQAFTSFGRVDLR